MNTDALATAALAIVSGIIGLAVLSVIVSPKAQTSDVIGSTGTALSNVIGAAVAPVTGGGTNTNPFSTDFLTAGLSSLNHSFGS